MVASTSIFPTNTTRRRSSHSTRSFGRSPCATGPTRRWHFVSGMFAVGGGRPTHLGAKTTQFRPKPPRVTLLAVSFATGVIAPHHYERYCCNDQQHRDLSWQPPTELMMILRVFVGVPTQPCVAGLGGAVVRSSNTALFVSKSGYHATAERP
jgi:hypothetical protein